MSARRLAFMLFLAALTAPATQSVTAKIDLSRISK